MDNKNYQVVIFKTSSADSTTEQVAQKLATLFKIPVEKAQQILDREEFVIKKQINKSSAEKFHQAISTTGANCRIEEMPEVTDSPLPDIEEQQTPEQIKPLTDPTRPAIQPLETEQQLNRSLQEKEQRTKALDTEVSPEKYCPECGTIREDENAVCLHCGYDPEANQQTSKKSLFILLGAGIAALVILSLAAIPVYQIVTKHLNLKEDLALAFETRNQVTAFIEKTNFWPNQNIDAGLPKEISNRSIESIMVKDDAVIVVTLKAEALDGEAQTLIFTPNTLKGQIVWNCIKGTLDESYRPEVCIKSKPIE